MMVKIEFVDVGGGKYGQDVTQTEFMRINSNINNINVAYDIYETMWNEGNLYNTYEEYLEDHKENELLKSHFEEVSSSIGFSWSLEELVEIINILWPEANASLVKSDAEVTLYW